MDDFRKVWQNQEVEEVKISLEELRARAAKFQRRIYSRNLRESIACLLVVVIFGAMAIKSPHVIPRLGCAWIAAAAIYITWRLQVAGTPNSLPADMGKANCLYHYRRELERERDLLGSVWKWYLGPMIPGMALLVLYGIVAAPPDHRWFPILYAVVAAVFLWLVGQLNHRAATHLNRQLQQLDQDPS